MPADVVKEAVAILKTYHIRRIVGDRYSGAWVRTAFRDGGTEYQVSDLTASDALLELLPMVNQGSIELLDDKRQTNQLIALERRTSRTGKDSLGHPQGGHDDRAVALALAAAKAAKKKRYHDPRTLSFTDGAGKQPLPGLKGEVVIYGDPERY